MARSLCWIEENTLAKQLDRLGVGLSDERDQATATPRRDRSSGKTARLDDDTYEEPTGPLPSPFDEPDESDGSRPAPSVGPRRSMAVVGEAEEDQFPPPIEPADEGVYDEGGEPFDSGDEDDDVSLRDVQLPLSQLTLEAGLAALAEALVVKTEGEHCFIADADGLALALYGSDEEHAAAGAALRNVFGSYRERFEDARERGLVLEYDNGASLHVAWIDTPEGSYTIGLFAPSRFTANLGTVMRSALGHVVENARG